MEDLQAVLASKKARLAELKAAAAKGYCSSQVSSSKDVAREMEIEDLEDQIKQMEQERKDAS